MKDIIKETIPSTTANVLQRSDVGFGTYRIAFDATFRNKKLVDKVEKYIDDAIKNWSNPFENWKEAHQVISQSLNDMLTLLQWDKNISQRFLSTVRSAIENFENASEESIKWTFNIIFRPNEKFWEKWPALSFLKKFSDWYEKNIDQFRKVWSKDIMEDLFWVDWTKLTDAEAFWFDYTFWPLTIEKDGQVNDSWISPHQNSLTAMLDHASKSKLAQFIWNATILLRNLWRRWLFFVDPAWASNLYLTNW